jgi:hypothetical protein
MIRSRHLQLEELEDRCVPATFGNPWPDATHLTLSFVPDGTRIGSQTSNLFATLNTIEPTAVWQRDILRAVQSWGSVANLNIGVVSDDGEALGTPGRPQGDPRFGDIRIAAGNFTSEVAAFSAPFDVAGGTSSGDVRLNSSALLNGGYDLYTVVLHEAGLVFGLPENLNPSSVMDTFYLGPRTGLGASDISALQTLYGARSPDAYEGAGGNDTLATATRLGLLANSNGVLSVGVDADLGSATDIDAYRFQAPTLTGGLVIGLQRARQPGDSEGHGLQQRRPGGRQRSLDRPDRRRPDHPGEQRRAPVHLLRDGPGGQRHGVRRGELPPANPVAARGHQPRQHPGLDRHHARGKHDRQPAHQHHVPDGAQRQPAARHRQPG